MEAYYYCNADISSVSFVHIFIVSTFSYWGLLYATIGRNIRNSHYFAPTYKMI